MGEGVPGGCRRLERREIQEMIDWLLVTVYIFRALCWFGVALLVGTALALLFPRR